MKEVRVFSGSPLGVEYDAQENTIVLSFAVEDGNHIHVRIDPQSLSNLAAHISHVSSQLNERKPRH